MAEFHGPKKAEKHILFGTNSNMPFQELNTTDTDLSSISHCVEKRGRFYSTESLREY